MPTYEYRCPACSRDFERFQRMSDPPGASCPDCGQAAERLISAGGGLLFKGDGFYITDHRSDAYKDKAKQDDKATTTASDAAERGDKAPKGTGEKDTQANGAKRDAASSKDSGSQRPVGGGSASTGRSSSTGRSGSAGDRASKRREGGERRGS